MLHLDALVDETLSLLGMSRRGTVVAVWPDGSMSAHQAQALPDYGLARPLASFVCTSQLPSRSVLLVRLRSAAEARGIAFVAPH